MSAMLSLDRHRGFCGCVVGRVVEVESIGVRGCTRRPVLDFRPTVGVIVAARAASATPMWPLLTGHDPPDAFRPGFSWACANGGCHRGCPQFWVRPRGFVAALLVEWRRSSATVCAGVLDHRYSTSAPQEVSAWLRVLPPRPLCGPQVTGPAPPGGNAPGCRGWTPMVGGVRLSAMRSRARSVVRGCAPIVGAGSCCPQCGV